MSRVLLEKATRSHLFLPAFDAKQFQSYFWSACNPKTKVLLSELRNRPTVRKTKDHNKCSQRARSAKG